MTNLLKHMEGFQKGCKVKKFHDFSDFPNTMQEKFPKQQLNFPIRGRKKACFKGITGGVSEEILKEIAEALTHDIDISEGIVKGALKEEPKNFSNEFRKKPQNHMSEKFPQQLLIKFLEKISKQVSKCRSSAK